MMMAAVALAALPVAAGSASPSAKTNVHPGMPRGIAGVKALPHRGGVRHPDTGVSSVTIGTGTTVNVTCTPGTPTVCTPSGTGAFLSVTDLENYLATSSVVVNTGSNGTQMADIIVDASVSWSAATSLTLDADYSITVNSPIVVNGSGPAAGLSFITNDTANGSGGLLSFGNGGYVNFADIKSSLSIKNSQSSDATSFTLLNSTNSNANTLQALVKAVNRAKNRGIAGDFALGASYDASGDKGGNGYSGGVVKAFPRGWFEGLGNTISGLTVKKKPGGLFESVGATLSNIRLAEVNISGVLRSGSVGALANSAGTATISGDTVSGSMTISGKNVGECNGIFWLIGGLIGAGGTIMNSESNVTINYMPGIASCAEIGGLVANDNGAGIAMSSASGNITVTGTEKGSSGDIDVGGLVGLINGAITQSYATGAVNVTAGAVIAGGLVGGSGGTVTLSYATGDVMAAAPVKGSAESATAGGLIGRNYDSNVSLSFASGDVTAGGGLSGEGGGFAGGLVGYDSTTSAAYSQVYATGNVISSEPSYNSEAGGLIGYSYGGVSIDQAYASGVVSAALGYYTYSGGFLAYDYDCSSTVTNSYWDTDDTANGSEGCSYSGLTGETTAWFTSGTLPPEFDPGAWTEGTLNNGFPYLINNPPPQ
jgi:hypothetical protein